MFRSVKSNRNVRESRWGRVQLMAKAFNPISPEWNFTRPSFSLSFQVSLRVLLSSVLALSAALLTRGSKEDEQTTSQGFLKPAGSCLKLAAHFTYWFPFSYAFQHSHPFSAASITLSSADNHPPCLIRRNRRRICHRCPGWTSILLESVQFSKFIVR